MSQSTVSERAPRTAAPFELTQRRRENQELNIAEYRAGSTRLRSRPLALFIELTQNCNLRCPMCRYGEKYRPDLNMSPEMFTRIADELFPYAHIVDLRGWGESTMLPRFESLLAQTLHHRVQPRLVTNGQINKRRSWDLMMQAHGIVTISCDAADPELFQRLRAGGTVQRLCKTVRSIVAFRDRHGAPRENVVLNTAASLDNLDDLPNIVTLAATLDLGYVAIHPLIAHLSDPAHLRQDLDRTAEAYAAAAERGRQEGVVIQLGAAPDPALALPDKVRRPPCMHPWAYVYVSFDGGVGFCDHLMASRRFQLGSLREQGFEEIWNGPEWVRLREAHLAGRIPDRYAPCRYSYAQRYVEFEHLLHPDRAGGLVTNQTHLEIVQRRDPERFPALAWLPELAIGTKPAPAAEAKPQSAIYHVS